MVWEGVNPALGGGEYRRAIAGVALATFYPASGVERVRYLHTDHLGSIVAMSDENGLIESRTGFDAWGQRRNGHDWSDVWQQWLFGITPAWAAHQLEVTPRGYTGHEHVDDMGLIHMNGRIYDALLGRFLQADPFVEDSTTLNRYTYVHNNPLAYTDPSGYFSLKKFFKLAAVVAISVYSGGTAAGAAWGLFGKAVTIGQAFAAAVVGGAITGAIASGSVEGALWGAFAGAVFFGVGQQFAGTAGEGGVLGTSYSGPELARASVAHGIAGGTIAEMQGGKFGHGFFAAGISKAATPAAMSVSSNDFLRGVAVAIVGGTTSRISGGKFANGAGTAAMGFAFNAIATSNLNSREGPGQSSEDQEVIAAHGEVLVGGVSGKGGEVAKINLSLSVDVIDREGNLVGFYDIEISSTIGGPSAGNIRGRPSLGTIKFPTILKGSPLRSRSDIFRAFDGAQINFSGVNVVLGVGVTVGSFSIGDFHDPSTVISASGFSVGVSKLGGSASVDQVRFRPIGFKR